MESALDDIAAGTLEAAPYLRNFFLGEGGIEGRAEQGLEAIDAREISEIHNDAWSPYQVRVGRFGPYVEGVFGDERRTASLPEDTAPADLTKATLEQLLEAASGGDTVVGTYAENGQPMLLRSGRFGPYLQLGADDQSDKPKRISLPKGVAPADVTAELAQGLLSLPRTVGVHPETGETIEAHIGRYGPYVRHERTFASLGDDDDVLAVTLPRALELLAAKKNNRQAPLRVLGAHPETGEPVDVRDGRYGPYVKHGKTNASLRKDQSPDTIDLDEALALLAAREAAKGTGSNRGRGSAKGSKKRRS
jgi:DNA topoisomerase-1